MLSGLRSILSLVALTLALPLAVTLLGSWEQQRGEADWADLQAEHLRLTGIVEQLERRVSPGGRPDYTVQFRRNGQLYGGPLALTEAKAARDEIATLAAVTDARRILPPVVMWAAGIATALSALVLTAGTALDALSRASREVLVRGFALVRRVLPAVLAMQVVLGTVAFVAAVLFEAAALAQPGLGGAELKLMLLAAVAVLGSLYAAGSAIAGLRRTLSAFEPDPLPILGRSVSPAEAPGLWRLVSDLADRLGAVKPETIVVGLTEGFFVSAGAKVLEPGGERLSGTTLYVPLPYLPSMRPDEVASILGHELAHFAGGDAAYSLRFLPIYAGVGRSLDAVAVAGGGSAFGLLTPATRLGLFVMERFHHAVRRWSRVREFAADAAGATLTSPEAAGRALLRTGVLQARIAETLGAVADRPDVAPPDLVEALRRQAVERGSDDPAAHLGDEQPHPTDTHPPTRDRVARLGLDLTPDLLAAAATPPAPGGPGGLASYLADPEGLCRRVTADFLAVVRQHEEDVRSHMAATVAAVGDAEHVLHENTRAGAIVFLVAGGIFLLAGLALAILGMPGLSIGEARLVAAVALAGGLAFAALGLFRLRREEWPYLVLRSDAMVVTGLDRPIAWNDIADLDMTLQNNGFATRLLLPPEAPFPRRMPGRCRAKLDPKRRIVTITAGVPRGMKAEDFVALISRYRAAAEARRFLAEVEASPAAPPSASSRPTGTP